MNENKTKSNTIPIEDFINNIQDDSVRSDSLTLCAMMSRVTGELPVVWGDNMVGFGTYHYKYATGREGDTFLVGFSPRKQKYSIYIVSGLARYTDLLAQLGPHSTGKSCLYVKNLNDINKDVLQKIITQSVKDVKHLGLA